MSGLAYQSVIELLDAHSENWGWSWSDMAANTLGVAVMMSQELAWNEQRFQLKFSSFPVRYTDPVLKARAIDQFGHTWAERTLKDYNSQTYWLSLNPQKRDARKPAAAMAQHCRGLQRGQYVRRLFQPLDRCRGRIPQLHLGSNANGN